jgi:hypothetical protein
MTQRKSLPDIIITELVLIKADWKRTFIGTIRKEADIDGNSVFSGSVIVQEGMIYCKSSSQEDLMNSMDAICLMKLDFGLHDYTGVTIKIFGTDFYLS